MKENRENKLRIKTETTHLGSKMHPVVTIEDNVVYWVSDDETTLCVDVGEAFRGFRRPIRYLTADNRIEMIHTFIESNLPDFYERVVCLILKNTRFCEDEHVVINGRRLKKSFPNLGSICCKDEFDVSGVSDDICVLDPFEIGEMCFNLAQDGDIVMANTLVRDLWALDHKWARFFREVARDYYRKPEDHSNPALDDTAHHLTGMDHLFYIYLLGWYYEGELWDFENGVVTQNMTLVAMWKEGEHYTNPFLPKD